MAPVNIEVIHAPTAKAVCQDCNSYYQGERSCAIRWAKKHVQESQTIANTAFSQTRGKAEQGLEHTVDVWPLRN